MPPSTYKAIRRTTGKLPLSVQETVESLPSTLGSSDVLIRIHAVSLNFRDVGMLIGKYPVPFTPGGIVGSDCAAEVVATGSDVKDFAVGDHVAPIFTLNSLRGDEEEPMVSLGGEAEGVLREYAVFDAKVLVHLPKYLSWEEASLLTCAGVTAWNALNGISATHKDAAALLEGTGGVSMMAALLCLATDIQPILTSSSDEKIHLIKTKVSPHIQGINYKTTADLSAAVLELTHGKGVDFVVNNAGLSTLPDDLKSLRLRGTISIVGFLGGFEADWNPSELLAILLKRAKVQGIAVGSKRDYESLVRFLEEKNVSFAPVVDRVFPFSESKEALDYLLSGKHIGKVVVKLQRVTT